MNGSIVRERHLLKQWALERRKAFPLINKDVNSYFSETDDFEYLVPYGFDTVSELESLMKCTFSERYGRDCGYLAKLCAIASFKIRQTSIKTKNDKKVDELGKIKIPDYIYTM